MKTPISPNLASLRALLILILVVFTTHFTSANTELWIGVHDVSITTNWSDNANWSNVTGGGNAGLAGNAVIFGDGGSQSSAGVINSVIDLNLLNPTSLTFTNNSGAGNFDTVFIPTGVVVTNTGSTIVGIQNSTANSYVTTVGFQGGGTFVQTGTPLQVDNSTTIGGSGQLPTLDLSGLTNFIYINTNAGSAINVAGIASGEARGSGLLTLAAGSNFITVSNINMAIGTGNGGIGGTLNLGTGTNIINVANLNLASAGKVNSATIKFLGPTGGLRIRGFSGADTDRSVNLTFGTRATSGSGTAAGTLNLLGGYPVDIKVNSVSLGRSSQNGPGNGTISFDTGTVDATTIAMATTTTIAGSIASGTINVNGGFLIVSNLSMVNQAGTTTSTGTLNITAPGAVICSNSIVKTTTAGVANINMAGGSLTVATNIGTTASPIDGFAMGDSALTVPASLVAAVHTASLNATGTANTLNVSSVPNLFAYPAQFPLIAYTTVLGDNTTFVIGTLPGTFTGYISNNVGSLSIDVVITNGPALAALKSITWNGTPTGAWNTSPGNLNWLTNSVAVNYNQGDTVTFNDSLTGTPSVNLTQTLTPGGLLVNNSLPYYVFTGLGKISGATGLTKTGNGTLVLDNSGVNDFVGPVSIGAGGALQLGNNDANGNLPAAASWDNEGLLVFSHANNILVLANVTGVGSLVQSGSGKLTINTPSSYTGNTLVSNGNLTLTGAGNIPSTALILARGGTFDVSTATPSLGLSPLGLSNGGLIVGTNNISTPSLSTTNSTIQLVANAFAPSIVAAVLTSGGTTNYINVTAVQNVPDSPGLPVVIPIITYNSANFVGGFNFAETNFPNAYISNDVANSSIDLVLTAAPYLVTWNGGSATGNNWSDSNNWTGVTIAANDNLVFDGTTRLSPLNDTAAGTTYSNVTFTGAAGSFTLGGNPIAVTGSMVNNSANPQTVLLGLNFGSSISLNGTAGPLIIGGGLTNTLGATGSTTLTLTGTGILTNILNSKNSPGGTNIFLLNDGAANWTLMDNASSSTVTVPWVLEDNNGTLNFGSATSAPKLVSTSAQGLPQDDQIAAVANSAGTLNFSNGVFTTTARLNTGTASGATGTINQYAGTINIGNQFQGANAAGGISAVNLFGGVMNIGPSTNYGQFYVSSRGVGVLTVTNSALLNCGILDVSRSILAGTPGIINLDGGVIVANSVGTATANAGGATTGSTATFNFNGGILRARTNSTTFFRGSIVPPVIPITGIVRVGGAIIDSDTNNITFTDPLLTDPNLFGAPDGGLKKLGTGTLTMLGANTYIGNTLVGAGTLILNGVQGASAVTVSNAATLGGNGVIGSNVTVNVGGTLSPGNNAIGVLTVAGNVSLAGTTTMEIDKVVGTNDLLLASNPTTTTTISYGGTLNVVTLAGSIASTDIFKLFSASNYVGSFTGITPATPGPGLGWNTANLNVNGTLSVIVTGPGGPTTNATITKVSLSGTNLLVHGTNNNVPNNTLHYVVLTTTNVATPLANWTPVVTNTYNADGTLDYTNPVNPTLPRQFIDIQGAP